MPIEAVVFDLDDTLYPERRYAYSGFTAVAKAFAEQLGDPAASLDRMKRLLDSPHRPRVFDALLDEMGITDRGDLVAQMIETYRGHTPSIALFDDVDAVLAELRKRCRLGLLTDGRPAAQWAKIDALQSRERFDAIVVTGDLGPGFAKPSPRPFEVITQRLAVTHDRCVYVADNPSKDFIAPNSLGWKSVQVRRPSGLYTHETPALGGEPLKVIESLSHLAPILRP